MRRQTKQDREDWIQEKLDEYVEAIEKLDFEVKYDEEALFEQACVAWENMMADIGDQMMEERRDREAEND